MSEKIFKKPKNRQFPFLDVFAVFRTHIPLIWVRLWIWIWIQKTPESGSTIHWLLFVCEGSKGRVSLLSSSPSTTTSTTTLGRRPRSMTEVISQSTMCQSINQPCVHSTSQLVYYKTGENAEEFDRGNQSINHMSIQRVNWSTTTLGRTTRSLTEVISQSTTCPFNESIGLLQHWGERRGVWQR